MRCSGPKIRARSDVRDLCGNAHLRGVRRDDCGRLRDGSAVVAEWAW